MARLPIYQDWNEPARRRASLRRKSQPWFQIRNRTLLLADLLLIVASVLASFALRLDLGPIFLAYLPAASLMVAVALLVKPVIYHLFGLYRRYWVYAARGRC